MWVKYYINQCINQYNTITAISCFLSGTEIEDESRNSIQFLYGLLYGAFRTEVSKLSKHLDYRPHYPSKSVATAGVKNIFLSVGSSKQRNTDTLIPPSDIVFTAVCWRKKTSPKIISPSLCVSMYSLQAVVTSFRLMRDKITSPELSSSWWYVAVRQLKFGWHADSSHVRKLQIDCYMM